MWGFNLGVIEWMGSPQLLLKRGKTVRNVFENKKQPSVVSGRIKFKMIIKQPSESTGNWISLPSGLYV